MIPVLAWFTFFVCFEPNNYFGLRQQTSSSQPVARVRSYEKNPGTRLLLGDSRLAHMDEALIEQVCGEQWQNLAFGGASLKEVLDLAEHILDSGNPVDSMTVELTFYNLNAGYNTDRFADLEKTLQNPLAYCFNLEYNINALTACKDWLLHTPDTAETGTWTEQDYYDSEGNPIPVHRHLYEYIDKIMPKCESWTVSDQLQRIPVLAERCRQQGIRLVLVMPPMAQLVRTRVCQPCGIEDAMLGQVLPQLQIWQQEYGYTLLDYEWSGSCITDDDTQFFDGFHLDEVTGLPLWTQQLFTDIYSGF